MYSNEKQNAAFAHKKQHNTVDRETATAAAMWQPGQILCQKGQFIYNTKCDSLTYIPKLWKGL